MKTRSLVLACTLLLATSACSKKKTNIAPQPTRSDSIAVVDSLARMQEMARLEAEAKRQQEALLRARNTLTDRVLFEYDQDEIPAVAAEALKAKAAILRVNPDVRIRIEGHADDRGSGEYNLALGQRRAQAVREYLMAYGISSDRLFTVSYGEESPVDPRQEEAGWSQNRRAEFKLTSGEVTQLPEYR